MRRPQEFASDADDGQAQVYLGKLCTYRAGVEICQGSWQNDTHKQKGLVQKEGQTNTKKRLSVERMCTGTVEMC